MKYSHSCNWTVRDCGLSRQANGSFSRLARVCFVTGSDYVLAVSEIKTNCITKQALFSLFSALQRSADGGDAHSRPFLPPSCITQNHNHHYVSVWMSDARKESQVTLSDVRGFAVHQLGAFRPGCGCWWAVGNDHCFCFSWIQDGVVFTIHPQRCVEIFILPLFFLHLLQFLCVCDGKIPWHTECLLH